tara:strand:- start:32 stop:382 length:351 start_codon:yes stop_codon:yes gene_type:complete
MGKSIKDNNKWTDEANMLALYYYKYKTEFLGLEEKELCEMIGTTPTSFKKHASNFRRLHTVTEGLSDLSKAQAEIYVKYGKLNRYELFKEIKKVLPIDDVITNRLVRLTGRNLRKL